MTENREDRFLQDGDFIEVVSRQPGPRHLMTDGERAEAERRVAEGEDPADVAEDIALRKAAEGTIE